jgi:hypothetical protein
MEISGLYRKQSIKHDHIDQFPSVVIEIYTYLCLSLCHWIIQPSMMCLSASFTYTVLCTWHRYPKNYLRIICLRKVPKRGTSGRIFSRILRDARSFDYCARLRHRICRRGFLSLRWLRISIFTRSWLSINAEFVLFPRILIRGVTRGCRSAAKASTVEIIWTSKIPPSFPLG